MNTTIEYEIFEENITNIYFFTILIFALLFTFCFKRWSAG